MENKEQYQKTQLNVNGSEGTKDLNEDKEKSLPTDGPVSSTEGDNQKDLGDLSEQVKGSDADMDQNIGKVNE